MFKNKLAKAIGQVDTFINNLKAGIDTNARAVGNLDKQIGKTNKDADTAIKKIKAKTHASVAIQELEQDALYKDIKTAEALVKNLTQLKG